jgi:hypothetical protein
MAIFGGYTGARVAPLPSGFMAAAQSSANNLQKGIASMGEGIGDALKQYGKNKEESEILSGLIEPAFQQAVENKSFYDRLSGKEAPPEARELSPEDAASAPPGITHAVTEDAGVGSSAIATRPGEAPDPAANFLSDIAGGKKLYEKFKAGDASRADKKAILANLQMYNAKGEHLMKQFQMKQMFAQDAVNQSVYNPRQGAETREAVPDVETFRSDNVSAQRILQLIGRYGRGGGNQVDPASGQTEGELAIGQNVEDEYLLETLKAQGFDISQYMTKPLPEASSKRPYSDESTFSDANLSDSATGLHSRIMELNKYATGEKRQPRSYDGGQPMREDEISEKIISLSDEYDGIRTEQGRRKGVDGYMAKRKAIEDDRVSRTGPLQEEMSSWGQYFDDYNKTLPREEPYSDEAKQTRGTMHERMRELLAESKSVKQQSEDALTKLAAENPEQHANAFPQSRASKAQIPLPPVPLNTIRDMDIGYTELLPQPDKVTPGEMREMTTAERKAQDIQTYVDANGLLDNKAMAAIDAKYPESGITSKPIAGVPGAMALFDQKTGKFLQVVTSPTLTTSERAAVDAVTFKSNTGYTGVAPTKEEAVAFREQIADAGKTKSRVKFLVEAAEKGKLDRVWWNKNKGEVQTAAGFLRASLRKEIAGPGAVSEYEQKMLQEVAADPSKLTSLSDLDIGRLSRILVEVDTSLTSKAEVLGLTPTGTQPGGQATQAPPGHRGFDKTGTENK